jgi:signal transduction histidine kinase
MKARRRIRIPIAVKLSVSIMLLLGVSVFGFATVLLNEEQHHTEIELMRVGRLVTQTLAAHAAEAAMRQDRDALQSMVAAFGKRSPDISTEHFISYVAIFAPDGTTLASLGTPHLFTRDHSTTQGASIERIDSDHMEVAAPIVYAGATVALLRVGMSQYYRDRLLGVVTTKARWTILSLLLAGAICSVLLARSFTQPLLALAACARSIGEGRWGSTVAINSADEIGDLAANFNEMSQRLAGAFCEVQRAQDRLVQAEKFSALGKLSSTLAHELKNPLTSLKMIVEAAMTDKDGFNCTREDGDVMLSEARRMERAVNDILAVAGERRLHRRPADFNELIRHAIGAVRYRLEVTNIRLDSSLDETIPLFFCDTDQMEQVFLNLILNAVEAMPRGGELGIETTWNAAAAEVRIEIRDTGAGVPEAARSQIFDPFFTTKEKGTGLGLSIAYSVIQKHGGHISLVSRDGSGATFVITLPTEDTHDVPHLGRG